MPRNSWKRRAIKPGCCCTSMIMSPFVLDRNVPLIRPPKGGRIEADRDEPEGVGASRGAGPSAQPAVAGGGCGAADAPELPAGEAVVEALSGGRRRRSEASQCRNKLASCLRAEISAHGVAAGQGEVRRSGGRAFRSDAGGGALGLGGRPAGGCGNAAALDAGGGFVEPRAEAAGTPSSAGAQGTLWRDGADGWQLSRLAAGARSRGLPDRYGR